MGVLQVNVTTSPPLDGRIDGKQVIWIFVSLEIGRGITQS